MAGDLRILIFPTPQRDEDWRGEPDQQIFSAADENELHQRLQDEVFNVLVLDQRDKKISSLNMFNVMENLPSSVDSKLSSHSLRLILIDKAGPFRRQQERIRQALASNVFHYVLVDTTETIDDTMNASLKFIRDYDVKRAQYFYEQMTKALTTANEKRHAKNDYFKPIYEAFFEGIHNVSGADNYRIGRAPLAQKETTSTEILENMTYFPNTLHYQNIKAIANRRNKNGANAILEVNLGKLGVFRLYHQHSNAFNSEHLNFINTLFSALFSSISSRSIDDRRQDILKVVQKQLDDDRRQDILKVIQKQLDDDRRQDILKVVQKQLDDNRIRHFLEVAQQQLSEEPEVYATKAIARAIRLSALCNWIAIYPTDDELLQQPIVSGMHDDNLPVLNKSFDDHAPDLQKSLKALKATGILFEDEPQKDFANPSFGNPKVRNPDDKKGETQDDQPKRRILVPLILADLAHTFMGRLVLNYCDDDLTQYEQAKQSPLLISLLGDLAAFGLQIARKQRDYDQELLEAVQGSLDDIIKAEEEKTIYQELVKQARHVTRLDGSGEAFMAAFHPVDASNQEWLRPVYDFSDHEEETVLAILDRPLMKHLRKAAYQNSTTYKPLESDVQNTHPSQADRLLPMKSLILLPVKAPMVKGQPESIAGILSVAHDEVGGLTNTDLIVLKLLAAQATRALEKAQVRKALETENALVWTAIANIVLKHNIDGHMRVIDAAVQGLIGKLSSSSKGEQEGIQQIKTALDEIRREQEIFNPKTFAKNIQPMAVADFYRFIVMKMEKEKPTIGNLTVLYDQELLTGSDLKGLAIGMVEGLVAHIINTFVTNSLRSMQKLVDKGERLNHIFECQISIDSSQLYVSIRDTGDGIPLDILAQLYERQITQYELEGGHGIGLLTVRRIVERLGGKILPVKTGSEGTTMRFCLPVEKWDGKTLSLDKLLPENTPKPPQNSKPATKRNEKRS